jgi:hypothetical protein
VGRRVLAGCVNGWHAADKSGYPFPSNSEVGPPTFRYSLFSAHFLDSCACFCTTLRGRQSVGMNLHTQALTSHTHISQPWLQMRLHNVIAMAPMYVSTPRPGPNRCFLSTSNQREKTYILGGLDQGGSGRVICCDLPRICCTNDEAKSAKGG